MSQLVAEINLRDFIAFFQSQDSNVFSYYNQNSSVTFFHQLVRYTLAFSRYILMSKIWCKCRYLDVFAYRISHL